MINTQDTFRQFQQAESLNDSVDLGLRTVEVRRIVGSVNRWQDFDNHFRLKNRSTRFRLRGIKRAMADGEILPPVKLYKVDDKYYVVDGNHRVAAAKELGQVFIDAYVMELLPAKDSEEHLLWRERSAFERKTNLAGIVFTELGLYEKLLKQIEQFHEEENVISDEPIRLTDAARQWYQEIYQPVVKEIYEEQLLDEFPGRTEADLFLYATYHRMAKNRLSDKPVSYREALADFHHTPQRTFGEKILDTLIGLVSPPPQGTNGCPYGLIIDDEGLVHVTKACKGCRNCKDGRQSPELEPPIISYEDMTKYHLF